MQTYFHSVTLNKERCTGCTNCLKRCPTEAIRVREGMACIMDERCIDCGECIRVCPYHAKEALTDPLQTINRFRYRIALPAPTLYGQFKNVTDISLILSGLIAIGFDEVFEVARAAELVTHATRHRLSATNHLNRGPVISSACPAVVRLIQVRFPELIHNILDLVSPMEAAAQIAKQEFAKRNDVPLEEIGAFFITPCPAKMTAIRSPIGTSRSSVDGAISILEVYGLLSSSIKKPVPTRVQQSASSYGVGWARSGGEGRAVGGENVLAVDGIHNVIRVLEEIENGKLSDLDFLEALACTGGCVGGPLTFENGYVAKNRIRKLMAKLPQHHMEDAQAATLAALCRLPYENSVKQRPVMKLDDNIIEAMRKMERIEALTRSLPGLDCGSCGSPSCRTLAEDIVAGDAVELDCIFRLKDQVKHLAQEMVDLSAASSNRRKM